MSSDHTNAADDHGAHGHDDHAAVDGIPESSPQDLILKVLTLVTAVVLYGTGIWWAFVPLSDAHETGHETGHEAAHEQAPGQAPAEHPQAH